MRMVLPVFKTGLLAGGEARAGKLMGNTGYGYARLLALSNDAGFEFRRKTAACTLGRGYA